MGEEADCAGLIEEWLQPAGVAGGLVGDGADQPEFGGGDEARGVRAGPGGGGGKVREEPLEALQGAVDVGAERADAPGVAGGFFEGVGDEGHEIAQDDAGRVDDAGGEKAEFCSNCYRSYEKIR